MKPVLDGYEFLECVGTGTFGRVYRAKNARTQEVCAVKVVSHEKATSRCLAHLSREVSILRALSHQNIVRLLDSVSSPHATFLVLEYCNGGDLHSYLKSRGHLPESFARRVAQQLVRAMDQLHEYSWIHRDIKLANVLLAFNAPHREAEVKLGDLGLAREMNLGDALVSADTPLDMSIVGTPLNMAPEIAKRQPYSFAADIWSLGLLVYELVCGKECFNGKSIKELNRNVEMGVYRIPKRLNLSRECVDFISQCLVLDPKERIKWKEVLNHPFIRGEVKSELKSWVVEDEEHYVMSAKRAMKNACKNCGPILAETEFEVIDLETLSEEDNNFVII